MSNESDRKASQCRCPYCDADLEADARICMACEIVIVECANCGRPVRQGAESCPGCGKPPS